MERGIKGMEAKRMNRRFMLLTVALIFSLSMITAGSAQSPSSGTRIPPEVIMKVPEGVKNRKAPVPFPHAKHKDFDCTLCHHNAYETLVMNKCSANGCHSNAQKREGTDSFYGAFHNVFEQHDRSCLDCHKTRGKGPTSCKDCHQQR
ncbi:MAG: cytochrome c3 family protein [bacterium]